MQPFFFDFWNSKQISNCFFKIGNWKSRCWRSYQATTGNWRQIWISFEDNFKGLREQREILAAVFDWDSKQQLNLLLFLLDWYCRKLGLTDLPGQDVKVTSDKKVIFISHQKCKSGNRDYRSHFSATFETTEKILFFFVRFILGKKGGWRSYWAITGNRHQI